MELWNYLGGAETVWLLVTVILCVIEGCTLNLVTLWFAFGGLAGLICTAFGGPVWLQLIIFIVISFLTMALFRPFAKRHLEKDREATNADRILGKTGLVTVDIDENCKGQISIEGVPWSAKSDETFKEGERVLVIGIEGCRAIVSSVPEVQEEDSTNDADEELSEAIELFEESSELSSPIASEAAFEESKKETEEDDVVIESRTTDDPLEESKKEEVPAGIEDKEPDSKEA